MRHTLFTMLSIAIVAAAGLLPAYAKDDHKSHGGSGVSKPGRPDSRAGLETGRLLASR